MAWQLPKTDWKISDYYNLTDWLRLIHNVEYLGENLNVSVDTTLLYIGRGYAEMLYVSTVNALERYLQRLIQATDIEAPAYVFTTTWHAIRDDMYTRNPNYTDWNRWEQVVEWVYGVVDYRNNYKYSVISGTCYAGSDRTLLRFSRGR